MPVTIRSRLLLLVLAVLLPGLAAAPWLMVSTWQAECATLDAGLRDPTRALATAVEGALARRRAIARNLAAAPELSAAELSASTLQAFAQRARLAMGGLAGWVELHDADRMVLSTQAAPPDEPALVRRVVANLAPRPLPGTARGLAAGGPASDQERDDAVWPVVAGGVIGVPGASGASPRGTFRRLSVVVTLLPQELQRLVDAQQLPPGWLGSVVDEHGRVVARQPGGLAQAGQLATPELLTRIAGQPEGRVDSVLRDGAPVLAYYSVSPQRWTYLTALPHRQAYAALPRAVLRIAAGALVLLAVAVGGALWVARGIVAPVGLLKQMAGRLQAGAPLEVRSTGIVEFDQVAAAMTEAGEAMRHARSDLEGQVADAVARARGAAQRSAQSQRVEALGRLTGGVAHDFNNLLGVVSNSAYLLQRLPPGADAQGPLGAIMRAVDGGSRLTQQLLRVAGRQPVRPEPLALAGYLPEVHELFRTVLGKRVDVQLRVAPGLPLVRVDASELELALINLAFNSRDAMPRGGHVWLDADRAEPHDGAGLPAGRYVRINVSDDGVGVAEEFAERVFEPFYTTKPDGHGSGLGLSQVHGFCTQAGGTARLTSAAGLGATVSLILPAHEAVAADRVPADPAGQGSGLAGRSVLLVDDNEALGDVTAALLETQGCTVHRASDAEQALACADRHAELDVVLSDVVMPGELNGVALARELRLRRPALPVLLITGYSTAAAAAVDGPVVLRKPCPPEQLLAALRRAVDGSAGPRAP